MFSTFFERTFMTALVPFFLVTACAGPGPAMMNRGIKEINAGQYAMAIADFSRAIQVNPTDAALWNFRGVAYYRNGQVDQAIGDYSRALELEPNNVLFLTNRAWAYRKAGRLDEGWKDVDLAIRLDPENENLKALLSSLRRVPPADRPSITPVGANRGGWLGVVVQSMTPELANALLLPEAKGALVSQVEEASPAFQAGLMPEDVILEFDRNPVADSKELPALVREHAPGRNVLIKVWRKGSPFLLSAILGVRPPDAKETPAPASPPIPAKEKLQSATQESKIRESAKEEQKTASAQSLVIHGISLKPSAVTAGGEFTLAVEFTATDPAVKAERVPVQLSYEIRRGTTLMSREKPINVSAYNGSRTQQSKKIATIKTLEKMSTRCMFLCNIRI